MERERIRAAPLGPFGRHGYPAPSIHPDCPEDRLLSQFDGRASPDGEGSAGSHHLRSVHRDGSHLECVPGLSRPVRACLYPLRWGDDLCGQSALYGESEGRLFPLSPPARRTGRVAERVTLPEGRRYGRAS